MPDLSAGSSVYGRDFPPSQYDQDWTLLLNRSHTTAASSSPVVAVNVTAPTSGRVFVALGCGVRNNAATTERIVISYQIHEDSSEGPIYQAFNSDVGVKSIGIGNEEFRYSGNFSLVEGLSPGRNYYFVIMSLVTGSNTIDVSSRNILVFPVP